MRSGIGMLALGSLLCVIAGVVVADEPSYFSRKRPSTETTPSPTGGQYFSRTGDTKPGSTSSANTSGRVEFFSGTPEGGAADREQGLTDEDLLPVPSDLPVHPGMQHADYVRTERLGSVRPAAAEVPAAETTQPIKPAATWANWNPFAQSASNSAYPAEVPAHEAETSTTTPSQEPSTTQTESAVPSTRTAHVPHVPTTTAPATFKSNGIENVVYPTTASNNQAPVVTLRWVKKSEINVGQECECQLVVKNAGESGVNDVTVETQFPPSVQLVATMPRPTATEGQLSWNFDSLAPGAEKVIRIRMIAGSRGQLATKAHVRFTSAATELFQVHEPLLELAVKGPNKVMVGDPASQIITITNPGTGVAKNVRVESTIPAGLEHSRGEHSVVEIGALNPGETRSVRLALAAIEGGQHTVQITAQADAVEPRTAAAEVLVVAPSVKIELKGPNIRFVGRSARYTLTVTNDGAAPSNNVRVLHRIPQGFEFTTADKGGDFDPSNMTVGWFVGRLEPGQSTDLHLELMAVALGSYVHRANAASEHGDSDVVQLPTEVDGIASLVLNMVDRDDPVEVGTEAACDISILNEGSKAATSVALACELPQGVEFLKGEGPTEYRVENGTVVFRPLEALEPGQKVTFRVLLRGQLEGQHRLRARLTSDSVQEPLIFEELTRFYGE